MSRNKPLQALDIQLVGDIYVSNNVWENLLTLCDECGSRFPGTPGEKQAAEFIAGRFRTYGLQNVRLESYPYQGWTRGAASLDIIAPIQRSIPCISLPYCPAAAIEAPLLSVDYGTPEQYESFGPQIPGRIVIVKSGSPPGYSRWIHRKEKYERTLLAGASAFIYRSQYPGVGPETGSLQSDRAAPIPGVSVSSEDGEYLHRLMKRHGELILRLHTTDIHEPRTSWNVVGELPGKTQPEEHLLIGCHYDGHDISQGAYDPASGLVVLIECARVLAKYAADQLGRTLRFVAFGTEEIGLTGAHRYVDAHRKELDRLKLLFNLDACGGPGRKGVVLHHWPDLESTLAALEEELACEFPVGQNVHSYSDHFPFFLEGVPTLHVGDPESKPTGRGFGHTAYDTVEKVEVTNLRHASSVLSRVLLRLSRLEKFPVERRTAEEVQKIVETEPNLEGYRVWLKLQEA